MANGNGDKKKKLTKASNEKPGSGVLKRHPNPIGSDWHKASENPRAGTNGSKRRMARMIEKITHRDIPSATDSAAVWMQNQYDKYPLSDYKDYGMEAGNVGNWTDIAREVEKRYPGLSKAVGDKQPGRGREDEVFDHEKGREKYGIKYRPYEGRVKWGYETKKTKIKK